MGFSFPLSRQVLPTSPMIPYKPTGSEVIVKGVHFGQRKLFLSELEYLVPISNEHQSDILIVYAGAANGSHLPFFFTCFPKCKFILIDPAPFCSALESMFAEKHPQLLELIHDCCTDAICERIGKQYSTYSIHFVSDIRSGNPPELSNFEHTQLINKDNEMQRSWCVSLGAVSAMLKFHPPYPSQGPGDQTPEAIQYVPGTMLWGVWGPKSTTEVRLVACAPFTSTQDYNCLEHEQQCYYYNTTNRYQRDVEAERSIISLYLKASEGYRDLSTEEFSELLSVQLGTPLFLPLSSSFTENDARVFTLLYYARCEDLSSLFEEWRGVVSLETLTQWSAGGSQPNVRGFAKYAYRKTLLESFNVVPKKRLRE